MPRTGASRHLQSRGSKAPLLFFSAEACKEYTHTELQHDSEDEACLEDLRQRHSAGTWRQADQQLWNDTTARIEQREERRRGCLRREVEDMFADLDHLSPLPQPLGKKSDWLPIRRPAHYANLEVRPFLIACEQGSLDVVRKWISEKKDVLLPVGVQDGLACAAQAGRVDVVRYLLDDGGAELDCSVVEGACSHRSLPLFEICVDHGYHPNQQIPSNAGGFGVALNHCLDNEEITLFLLEHGADPNLAPFQDARRLVWGDRSTPPMDRTCGLALDRAIENGSSMKVIRSLLQHGAKAEYSRPLHAAVRRRKKSSDNPVATQEETVAETADAIEGDYWRPLMELLISHGADVNAATRYAGTPLMCAISADMWDIVEFLLDHGADPKKRAALADGGDAFQLVDKRAGIPFDSSDSVESFLSHLADAAAADEPEVSKPMPEAVLKNPLVRVLQGRKAKQRIRQRHKDYE